MIWQGKYIKRYKEDLIKMLGPEKKFSCDEKQKQKVIVKEKVLTGKKGSKNSNIQAAE